MILRACTISLEHVEFFYTCRDILDGNNEKRGVIAKDVVEIVLF